MRLTVNLLAISAIVVVAIGLSAQTPDASYATREDGLKSKLMAKFRIDAQEAAPIKGAPFCATVVTEHTQNLSDGNRIHTSESSQLCRDSQGRTRRDAGLNLLGAAPQANSPRLVTIVDPVEGFRYLLDTGSKTAQKMPIGADKFFFTSDKAIGDPGNGGNAVFVERGSAANADGSSLSVPGADVNVHSMTINKAGDESGRGSENLGDQTIEGIRATGTRVTTVIPAGKMGNEKPITVMSELWYSPELKVNVMTKHDDPWAGELKTEFQNVSTAEPDSSLFTVPADYTVIEDKDGPVVYKLSGPSAPAQ